eukprot:4433096-Heterocapsa_arctica.AAC.1
MKRRVATSPADKEEEKKKCRREEMVFPAGLQLTTRFCQKATPEQVLSCAAFPEARLQEPSTLIDDMQVDERIKCDRDEAMKEVRMNEEVEVIMAVDLVLVVGPPWYDEYTGLKLDEKNVNATYQKEFGSFNDFNMQDEYSEEEIMGWVRLLSNLHVFIYGDIAILIVNADDLLLAVARNKLADVQVLIGVAHGDQVGRRVHTRRL